MSLITDLYESGHNEEMQKRATQLVGRGIQPITLLALKDEGAPYYDQRNAAYFWSLGIRVFACTPDKFPDLIFALYQNMLSVHERQIMI